MASVELGSGSTGAPTKRDRGRVGPSTGEMREPFGLERIQRRTPSINLKMSMSFGIQNSIHRAYLGW